MSETVLDASALLALLNGETGADVVTAALPEAVIGAVNLSEVIAKLSEVGMPEDAIHEALGELGLHVISFDEEFAFRAGVLRSMTRTFGLSLGDRACLALAAQRQVPVLTADHDWQSLEIGVDIQLIRARNISE